ncbi:MAG: hypothetical protein ACT4QD_03775 [Acidobacteriota bacterium]
MIRARAPGSLTRREAVVSLLTAGLCVKAPWVPRAQPRSTADETVWLDLATLSARIAAGELSPIDVTEAYLERIDRLNPALAAFVTITHRRAREDARACR